MTKREYLLTTTIYKQLLERGVQLVCYFSKCGKPLEVGDTIISICSTGHNHSRVRHYHKPCYLKMFM